MECCVLLADNHAAYAANSGDKIARGVLERTFRREEVGHEDGSTGSLFHNPKVIGKRKRLASPASPPPRGLNPRLVGGDVRVSDPDANDSVPFLPIRGRWQQRSPYAYRTQQLYDPDHVKDPGGAADGGGQSVPM